MMVEILVGPIGSGKSTYSASFSNASIVSQDSQGKIGHMSYYKELLKYKKVNHIIIDRMGFNKEQRAKYIKPALQAGYEVRITCIFLPYEECLKRVLIRENHPTIAKGDEVVARKVLDFFFKNLELPHPSEYKVTS